MSTQAETPYRLSANTNYEFKVEEISGPKKFTKSKYPGVPYFAWKVYFRDHTTNKLYIGEYIQPVKDTQEKFKVGETKKFHVTTTAGVVDEIEEGHLLPSATTTSTESNPGIRPALSASGQTYTFAMGYAKDIYCAMIAAGKVEEPAGDEGMEILVGMAKRVNDGILEMQQEQLNRK